MHCNNVSKTYSEINICFTPDTFTKYLHMLGWLQNSQGRATDFLHYFLALERSTSKITATKQKILEQVSRALLWSSLTLTCVLSFMHLSAGWTGAPLHQPAGNLHKGCDYLADFYSGGHLSAHFLPDALQQPPGWAQLGLQPSLPQLTWMRQNLLVLRAAPLPCCLGCRCAFTLCRNETVNFWSTTKPFQEKMCTQSCRVSCWVCWRGRCRCQAHTIKQKAR